MHTAAGNRLRDLRLDKGLSLRGAAEQMGIDPETGEPLIQEWTLRSAEKGKHRPQPRNARVIAEFYGVKPSEIWPAEEEEEERERFD